MGGVRQAKEGGDARGQRAVPGDGTLKNSLRLSGYPRPLSSRISHTSSFSACASWLPPA